MNVVRFRRLIMLLFHVIVGVGAVAGGLGAILSPLAPAGASADLLKTGPFETFLVPGIILFTLFGLGNLAAAVWLLSHWQHIGSPGQTSGAATNGSCLIQAYATGALGAGLMIWIVVQCLMLQMIIALHVIMFVVGVLQGLLAFWLLWELKAFPANVVQKVFSQLK